MIVAITGHRPEDCEDEKIVRAKIRKVLESSDVEVLICGMAAGVDLWAADEAMALGIEVWAARPWATHAPRWADEELYNKILEYASRVIVVTNTEKYPGPWVYHKRNEWMVDHATHVCAYWNGKRSGGTFACLKYAEGKKPIRNVY